MFKALTTIGIAAAAFLAARRLLDDNPRIEALPGPVQGPAHSARRRLLRARERAQGALTEARAEKRTAEAELMAEYHRKAGRAP
jgi:hypothetical protein